DARADRLLIPAPTRCPAVRPGPRWADCLAIPYEARTLSPAPAAIPVLERALARTQENPPERRGGSPIPRRGRQPRWGFRPVGLTDPKRALRRRSPPRRRRGTRGWEAGHPVSCVAVVLSRRVSGRTGPGRPGHGGDVGRGLGSWGAAWRHGSLAA